MDLDPTVIIPAILFTVVAIYFASALLSKKPDASSSSSSAGNKKPKVGYGDDIPPSRGLGEQIPAEPAASPHPEPPAPAVEDIGAAEQIQDVQVPQVKVKLIDLINWTIKSTKCVSEVLSSKHNYKHVMHKIKVVKSTVFTRWN